MLNRSEPLPTDVLIIGAGPTGLTLACELVHRGVQIRIIDCLLEPSTKPKAVVMHSRTLEHFDKLGIVEDFLKKGRRAYAVNLFAKGESLARFDFAQLNSPYPCLLNIPQHEIETILSNYLRRKGVEIERGSVLERLSLSPDYVEAGIQKDKKLETVRVAWLAGCDGARSHVRNLLGIEFEEKSSNEMWWAADVQLRCELPTDEVHFFLGENAFSAWFPLDDLENKKWRVACRPADSQVVPSSKALQTFLESVDIEPLKIMEVDSVAPFKVKNCHTERMREGRAFLLGEAAHINIPIGGQGMNAGMQDAFNLGWKLGMVVRQILSVSVLDSYEQERKSLTSRLLRETAILNRIFAMAHSSKGSLTQSIASIILEMEMFKRLVTQKMSRNAVAYPHSLLSVSDWFGGGGLSLGTRFPDGVLKRFSTMEDVRIYDIIRQGEFEILVFSGQRTNEANVLSVARIAHQEFSGFARTHIVSAYELPGLPPAWAESTYVDLDAEIHRQLGVTRTAIYVVRPDGYLCYKCKPASLEKLTDYFNKRLLSAAFQV